MDKQLRFFIGFTSLVLIIDQVLKYLVRWYNPHFSSKFLKIQLITNTGAGFGILKDSTALLTLISLAVAIAFIYYYNQIPKENSIQTFYALFLGGVIGNLIDRFLFGQVTDFIDPSFWPAFNIADAAITIGVIGIILRTWKK